MHACLEGPENGVYYRGKGLINKNTKTTITLPEYVKNLADDFTIHVTSINRAVCLGVSILSNNSFDVFTELKTDDTIHFNWLVFGSRGSINVEPKKNNIQLYGDGPYKWIN